MRRLTFMFCLLLLALRGGEGFAQSENKVVIITHAKNPVDTLRQEEVADAFLRRTTFWPNNELIRPVDLPPSSSLRARFSREFLRRSESAVRTYWQQRIFTGRGVPPPELATEKEVIAYVQAYPGAIGYVSGGAALPSGVKTVRVR